jgi:glycosyltransferase involved in cell wall biosynthesis
MIPEPGPAGRIVFDISTLCRWEGQPTGIIRVEREFARWARHNLESVVFGYFDPDTGAYRAVADVWVDQLISRTCVIDRRSQSKPESQRRHFVDRMSIRARSRLMWALQFQRKLLVTLDRTRRQHRNVAISRAAGQFQRRLMSGKHQKLLIAPDGTQRAFVEITTILRNEIAFSSSDVLMNVGAGWAHTDIEVIAAKTKQTGLRFIWLCQDIIPLLCPQFFKAADAEEFRVYFHRAAETADLVVFSSRTVEADARRYCAANAIGMGRTAVTPFGSNPVTRRAGQAALIKYGLTPNRYVLYVSTIEPRKGHRFLLEVWRRLLADGVPQKHGFKLVFVGRIGWEVDDLIAELDKEAKDSGTVHMLHDVDDTALGELYESTAFCTFPSEYEGYGLMLIEAFQYGKAVIASNGGAIPEVVAGCSPCLDHDRDAWQALFAHWITDDQARRPYEDAIRARPPLTSWDEAAARFFKLADPVAPIAKT